MSTFTAAIIKQPDPLKRVNYPFGLVLGVDEFVQEQTYLLEQTRSHQRLLHGFGTVWGLAVTAADQDAKTEIRIAPGSAVVPAGMRVCVPRSMCAKLDDWLAKHQNDLTALFGNPPFSIRVCVILCYRECQTDVVPLPGEPCRSDEESRAPSRIEDSFELRLGLHAEDFGSPPAGSPPEGPLTMADGLYACPVHSSQTTGIEAFGALLRRIVIHDGAGSFVSREDVLNEVRAITTPAPVASPPASPSPLPIPTDQAHDILQAAARVWAVEVLPELLEMDGQATCGTSGSDCLLLSELTVPVGAAWGVSGGAAGVSIDDAARPVLLSSGVMQEWLLAGGPVDKV